MKRFHVLTIFPEVIDSYASESLFKRAQEKKIISVKAHNIRDFSRDRHQKVDDRPFGGGPGMVFKVEPIYRAVESILKKSKSQKPNSKKTRTILFSTRGKKFDAKIAKRLAKYENVIFICGRYEGVDERVAQHVADEEISIGDFVLSGGELPALMVMEAICRFVPGFLGKEESLEEINGSFATYTRPEIFVPRMSSSRKRGTSWPVPKVLLSGNHKKIEEWRNAGH